MPNESESDYDTDDDDGDGNGQQQSGPPKNDLRELRKKAKERDELAAKVAQFERENAFRDAGINPSDPKTKYFIKGYDGELTADAIKAEATAAGFIQTDEQQQAANAQQQQAEQQRANQQQSHERMDGAGQGAGNQTPDAQAELVAKMGAAKSMDELIDIATSAGMPTIKNR
jgi:hypothetical protein